MKIREAIVRRIRGEAGATNVAGDVNAVVSANVNERGASESRISSRRRIVQRSGKTVVDEEERTTKGGG